MLKNQGRRKSVRLLILAVAGVLQLALLSPAEASAQPQIQALSAGNGFSCALISGQVSCWGVNDQGQLGDGSRINRATPVAVRNLGAGVRGLSVGADHACATTAAQLLKCWGANTWGQLGVAGAQSLPQPVPLAGPVRSVSAGQHYSCAVTTAVYCWGRNSGGQLGSRRSGGYQASIVAPLPAAADRVRTFIGYACARLIDGTVACWGDNSQGFLGIGNTMAQSKPVRVSGLNGQVLSLSAGQAYHSCAAQDSGQVRCWGTDTFGEAGNGDLPQSGQPWSSPVAVKGLPAAVSRVVVGEYHSCAVAAGRPYCWGNNDWGQLGDNSTQDRSSATLIVGLVLPVSRIAAGFSHTCVATTDGSIWCWGDNGKGQLGDGSFANRTIPTLVSGISSGG